MAVINLRQFERVHAVLAGRTVSAAARSIGVSQPAASKLLRQVERELGLKLFHRESGRLRPTAEAETMYPEIERVLGAVVAVRERARELEEGLAGALTIAATPTVAEALLPAALSRFRKVHPRVKCWVQVMASHQVLSLVQSNRIDLGLTPVMVERPMLISEKLMDSQMICVVPATHKLAGRERLTLAELTGYPVISNLHSSMIAGLERHGNFLDLEKRIAVSINHAAAAVALVRAGAGLAFVDPLVLRDEDLHRCWVDPVIDISPSMVRWKGHPVPSLLRTLMNFLRAAGAEIGNSRRVGIAPLPSRRSAPAAAASAKADE
jgi:DNA-binding transcriptional LysR family regulator